MALPAVFLAACLGAAAAADPPVVALIIDDLGYRLEAGRQAIALPGPYAYAVLPHSPHGPELADLADHARKEVLLHLPMEAEHGNELLGPGALRTGMSDAAIRATVSAAIASVPHAVGINNHMGSLLTRQPEAMHALMKVLAEHPALFFVDSRTTAASQAAQAARGAGVAYASRDVFLDNARTLAAIAAQLAHLVAAARQRGSALGIAHPYPETLAVLGAWQPAADGVRLVSVRELLLVLSRSECGHQGRDAKTAHQPDPQG